MFQKLSEPVSVVTSYNHLTHLVRPLSLSWANRHYPILHVALHHTARQGSSLQHIFSVASNDLFFRLKLDTTNLRWVLEEVSDGLPD